MLKMNFSCLTESAELLFRARFLRLTMMNKSARARPCLSPPRFAPLDARDDESIYVFRSRSATLFHFEVSFLFHEEIATRKERHQKYPLVQ